MAQSASVTGNDAASFGPDDRRGLGYGQVKQVFHKSYAEDNNFPYLTPDHDLGDVEVDDASFDAVNKKVQKFRPVDPGAERSTDRLYFVGAATKLRACFERPDDVLIEIQKVDQILSVPRSYAKATDPIATIGWKAYDERPYRRTGTKRGWSEAPPLSKVASIEDTDDNEFYTLEDIADASSSALGESFLFNRHI